jgi:prepilin-type N-terminal cleavage/methylation domain-containing protein
MTATQANHSSPRFVAPLRLPVGFIFQHSSFHKGFTLVELLIVLVIIGLGTALAMPGIEALTNQGAHDRALRMIAGAVARAQDRALSRRSAQTITIDLDARLVAVSDETPTPLPAGVAIGIIPADEQAPREEGRLSLAVDRHGNIEPFELRIGHSTVLVANPFTGALEPPLQ